ncbi:putative pectin lyase A [Frankliniella fusca]|uniref:pectin lyase n=1 Tax=Frankliniella fusca TaxID=407009 RepID=A0AAE1GSY8_9NEOP|nr:putative pectin lyase A [Frankliniella fusca]
MKFSLALLLCVLPAVVYSWNQNCITKPVGFGYKTTGGAGGKTVKPKSTSELTNYLKSNQKLIIDLTKTFDYTNSEGWATSSGCYFQKCGNGFQESLAHAGTCNGRPATKVKYSKAGTTELIVGSNKSIISSNGKGQIKGKGLRIQNAKNVIIRDITISDINPEVIWAGDALAFDNVENVWVHKCTFARVGRQHLVTYQKTNKGITVSSCFFDGTSKSAAYCDGNHFWVWLFWGTHDEITLINNRVYKTAGRCPHAGGWSKSQNYVHLIGNSMEINKHVGIEPYSGAKILSEGNKWTSYSNPINPQAKGGHLAMVNNGNDQAACKKYFGVNCLVNKYDGQSKSKTWFDVAVLNDFSKLDKNAINSARSAVCI